MTSSLLTSTILLVALFALITVTEANWCGVGKYTLDNACVLCPAGTFQATASFATVCVPCSPGTYGRTTGLGACLPCEFGTYCPSAGLSAPILCPPGSVGGNSSEGQTSCSTCNAGVYVPTAGTGTCDSSASFTTYDVRGATGLPSYVQYLGCYYNFMAAFTVFNANPSGSQGDTIESCLQLAKNAGYQYFGLQDKGRCSLANAAAYAILSAQHVALSHCSASCTGNANEFCGSMTTGYTDLYLVNQVLQCPAGFYCPSGSSVGIPCPIGSFCRLSSPVPTACPAGTFSDTPGAESCTLCPAGTFSFAIGAANETVCETCLVGNFCPQGAVQPVQCPGGTFSDSVGASVCTICEVGSFASEAGATNSSCSSCAGGSFYSSIDGECVLCSAGSYSPLAGAPATCTPCDAGFYCPIAGATAPVPCPPGTYSSSTSAVNAAACISCAGITGSFCPGATTAPIPCPAGQYADGTGSALSCQECSPGTSSSVVGASSAATCTVCLPGSYTSDFGSPNCISCSPGSFCQSGISKLCTPGTYQPKPGASVCSNCDAGSVCPTAGMTINDFCPGGKVPSSTTTCTTCDAGYQIQYRGSANCVPLTSSATYVYQGATIPSFVQYIGCYNDNPWNSQYYHHFTTSGSTLASCIQAVLAFQQTPPLISSQQFRYLSLTSGGACSAGTGYGAHPTILNYDPNTMYPAYSNVDALCSAPCTAAPEQTCGSADGTQASVFVINSIYTCPQGSYCPGIYNNINCPKGTYNPNTGSVSISSCLPCPLGDFCNQPPQAAPTQCPAGTFSSSTGSISCSLCPIGTFSTSVGASSVSVCAACPAGTYTPSAGATSCIACQTGSSCPGGSAPVICAGGSYSISGSTSCSPCSAGTFSGPGESVCRPCTPGGYCPFASSAPTLCPLGTSSAASQAIDASTCVQCVAGFYADMRGLTSCIDCPASTYSPTTGATSSSACAPCPEGMICTVTTSTGGRRQLSTAVTCPPGQYSATGSTSCTNCPANTYSPTAGAHSCLPCPASRISMAGASVCGCNPGSGLSSSGTCSPCPVGTYAVAYTGTPCLVCPAGKYSSRTSASACTLAPAGSFAGASGLSTYTVCPSGKYSSSAGLSTCTKCPGGTAAADSGSTSCINCAAGYYASGTGAMYCSPTCGPGQYSSSTATGQAQQSYCNSCSPGYFNANWGMYLSSQCIACPSLYISATGSSSCADPSMYALSMGCFADSTLARDLPNLLISSGATVQSCSTAAINGQYLYFGIQSGQCWAGNSYALYGPASCGGSLVNSVYSVRGAYTMCPTSNTISSVSTATIQYQSNTLPAFVSYIGCYGDDSAARDLPNSLAFANDILSCALAALQQNYLYFGLQSGSQCWAGNSYGSRGTSSSCTQTCGGNSAETCGGRWANSVFSIQTAYSCPVTTTYPLTQAITTATSAGSAPFCTSSMAGGSSMYPVPLDCRLTVGGTCNPAQVQSTKSLRYPRMVTTTSLVGAYNNPGSSDTGSGFGNANYDQLLFSSAISNGNTAEIYVANPASYYSGPTYQVAGYSIISMNDGVFWRRYTTITDTSSSVISSATIFTYGGPAPGFLGWVGTLGIFPSSSLRIWVNSVPSAQVQFMMTGSAYVASYLQFTLATTLSPSGGALDPEYVYDSTAGKMYLFYTTNLSNGQRAIVRQDTTSTYQQSCNPTCTMTSNFAFGAASNVVVPLSSSPNTQPGMARVQKFSSPSTIYVLVYQLCGVGGGAMECALYFLTSGTVAGLASTTSSMGTLLQFASKQTFFTYSPSLFVISPNTIGVTGQIYRTSSGVQASSGRQALILTASSGNQVTVTQELNTLYSGGYTSVGGAGNCNNFSPAIYALQKQGRVFINQIIPVSNNGFCRLMYTSEMLCANPASGGASYLPCNSCYGP